MEIDQEIRKGKNFMKRIKRRWDLEFPGSKRMAHNLVDNARRFKKGWRNYGRAGRADGRISYTRE